MRFDNDRILSVAFVVRTCYGVTHCCLHVFVFTTRAISDQITCVKVWSVRTFYTLVALETSPQIPFANFPNSKMARSSAEWNYLAANLRIMLKEKHAKNLDEKKKEMKLEGKRWQKVSVNEANNNDEGIVNMKRKRDVTSSMQDLNNVDDIEIAKLEK